MIYNGEYVNYFGNQVVRELERARLKHPGNQHSAHEGYAVLLEEVEEVWDRVKNDEPDAQVVIAELIQVAAMAQRMAEEVYGG